MGICESSSIGPPKSKTPAGRVVTAGTRGENIKTVITAIASRPERFVELHPSSQF